jgi:competence ComEA-like helix-hairpin-helix protein
MLIFTPAEKRAILITILFILCACLYQFIHAYQPNPYILNYEEEDSLFVRLSQQTISVPGETIHVLTYQPLTKDRAGNLIHLNTATAIELQQLPRIGPAMAKRIIAYRKRHNGFKNNQELMQVRGIGIKTYNKIKPFLARIR